MRWTAPFELFLKIIAALWLWDVIRRPIRGLGTQKGIRDAGRPKAKV